MGIEALLEAEKITAIITDLDNTLWTGTIAEGEQPVLYEDYYAFLCEAYEKGIQIVAVSKNDDEDVVGAFTRLGVNPDMFTKVVANWDPKYTTIEKLLTATHIRQETVVFVDDNALERTEVAAKLPKVYCLDATEWKVLQAVPYIQDKKRESLGEIRERVHRYRTALNARLEEVTYHTSDPAFLRSLERAISIGNINVDHLDRFARLLHTTHRLNFNPDTFTDYNAAMVYLHERLTAGDDLVAVSTYESGLSLGFTGALVVHRDGDRAEILDGTFSCSIIGRGFEQKTLVQLIEQYKEQCVRTLTIPVTLTSSNQRVQQIVEELGFTKTQRGKGNVVYELSLQDHVPSTTYEWITVRDSAPELEQRGIPSVKQFFDAYVEPLFEYGSHVLVLGAAHGEVIGHLDEKERERFYTSLRERRVTYTKVDLLYYPREENIVADAENLEGITRSQDVVVAIELLEHTEHFWNVINEAIRVCRVGGHIALTVPSHDYPKHEYPIDLWRLGPVTLTSLFPDPNFEIVQLETEGQTDHPWRTKLLVRKLQDYDSQYQQPDNGIVDWTRGITVYP